MGKFKKNAESSADSAKSQNLAKKELCEATENSPASWCKKSGKASSSASADFLLEADKRGSPPKSEKAAAFWRVGGAGRGVQPFLRKESSELSGKGGAESNRDSSPTAQNDNLMKGAESSVDSAPLPKNTRLRSFIIGANGLSLGISIVVAILLGIGAGILMQKIFKVAWVLFLGVFWGVAAAVLNVYKVYKAELRDFEKLANDPKYKH